MDIIFLLSISFFLLSFIFAFNFLLRPHRLNLPPTPPFCLPIIGHFHLLKHPVHQSLQNLSQKYGHVLSLRLGSRLVVVVSSPSAVRECFTKNDTILANRPFLDAAKCLEYNHTTVGVSPYGEHWRNLRRICSLEIFSTNRLNLFMGIRKEEVIRSLCKLCGDYYYKLEDEFRVVELQPMLKDLTLNIVMRMVSGKKFYEEDSSSNFKEVITQILAHGGATNPGDFIPLWNWIDPTGFMKRVKKIAKKSDELLQELIDEIRNQNDGGNTMIQHLLSLQKTEPQYYSDQTIKGLIQDILIAGLDTSVVTLEWGLSQLFNNPEVLKKAKVEIENSVGHERLVNEADLPNLSYLQGIISETLRLHPPAPLLVPHCAFEECKIEGYDIPRDTIVLINAWAIHRDPSLWEDATSFKPERHAKENEGVSYKLIPFGMGRRACPGAGMAQRVVGLTLASLIQSFEWERVNNSLIDMSEGKGLTMPRVQPLVAKCKPCPIMRIVLNDSSN